MLLRERSLFMAGEGGRGGSAKSIGGKKSAPHTPCEYAGKISPPPMTLSENFYPHPMPLCCCCAPTTVIIHVMSLSRKKS